jgi:small-conductance mechanosensitive channel
MDLQLVFDELIRVVHDIIQFIPRLINGLLIIVVGYLIAAAARLVIRFILHRLGFDSMMEQSGVTHSLRGVGVKIPLSRISAQLVFLLLLLSFLVTAMRLMGLEAVAAIFQQLLDFLPTIIAALIVFLIGSIAARFVGDLVTAIASGNDLGYAGRLGRLVQYLLTIFVVVLAIGALGVQTTILITALTIMIGAFGLALGLGFGLGSRNVIYHILAGYYVRQRFPTGQRVVLGDIQGEVSDIGTTSIVIKTGSGATVVPHSMLFEASVDTSEGPAST